MLGFLWLQEPWLEIAEKIGGTGFVILCLLVLLVWHAALGYFKFGALEKGLVEVRQQMMTRDSFGKALAEMEKRLNDWANDRFLTRTEYQALLESRERFGRSSDSD
jgi:hypothetical protein